MAVFYATCAAGTEALAARFAADSLKHFGVERRGWGGLFFWGQERSACLGYFGNWWF